VTGGNESHRRTFTAHHLTKVHLQVLKVLEAMPTSPPSSLFRGRQVGTVPMTWGWCRCSTWRTSART